MSIRSRLRARSQSTAPPNSPPDSPPSSLLNTRPGPRRHVGTVRGGAIVLTASVVVGGLVLPSAVEAAPSPGAPIVGQAVGLSQGSRGNDVKEVQRALIAAGIWVPGGADGVFGSQTRAALIRFQKQKNLTASGSVDSATAGALGLSSTPSTSSGGGANTSGISGLSEGARGEAVKNLQRTLVAAGVSVRGGIDGIFGPGTRAAVAQFQSWNGLQPTGKVTSATVRWLEIAAKGSSSASSGSSGSGANAAASSNSSGWVGLKYGSTGSNVKSLQSALMAAGITVRGGADGVFGTATRSSVSTFQRREGLSQTGAVDNATATRLASAGGSSGSAGSSASSGYAGLKQGSRGESVKQLQRALMQSGLSLRGGADGIFGPVTKATLLVFQRVNGLAQSGVLSARGAELLGLGSSANGIASVGYPVFGERSERVKDLQRALLNAGISFAGGADGAFGGATAGAVMEYQRRLGLAVTGKIDSATASKLALGAAPAPAPPSSAGINMKVFPIQGQCWFGDTWLAPRGGGRTHQGVDIIAAEGKLLYAVVDGTISKIYRDFEGSRAGNGLRVAQPDGTYFTYLHLQDFAPGIQVGTKVKAGDVIGYNGNTGNSATPHLHFEIHPKGGAAINPYPLVKQIDACSVTAPRS